MEDYLLCTLLYILLVAWLLAPSVTLSSQPINYFPDLPDELLGEKSNSQSTPPVFFPPNKPPNKHSSDKSKTLELNNPQEIIDPIVELRKILGEKFITHSLPQ